jgi:hypothetical protein
VNGPCLTGAVTRQNRRSHPAPNLAVAVSSSDRKALLLEAREWADFWRRSRVLDPRQDWQEFTVQLLRYQNAGDLTDDELREICEIAEMEHLTPVEGTTHPQTHIKHGTQEADVDVGIAPLILELWRGGWETWTSCQERPDGRAYVDFYDSASAEDFLTAASGRPSDDPGSIYCRIYFEEEPDDWIRYRRDRIWTLTASAVRYQNGEIGIGIMVAFPHSDIDEVTQRLREANDSGAVA